MSVELQPHELRSGDGSRADPFAMLVSAAPALTVDEAQRVAEREFGMRGEARLLTSERDQNFLLRIEDGREFILKIANAAEDTAITAFQTGALEHLARHAPQIPVPRIVPTRSGTSSVRVEATAGQTHVVRLLTFLHGTPWRTVETSGSLRRALGGLLARLDRGLRGYFHPAAGYELAWDLKRAARLRELLPAITDPGRRLLVKERLDRFDRFIAPQMGGLRAQVIYNDLNPSNVFVDPEQPTRICGVIDFGDLVHAPLVSDVAVAASYHVADGPDALAAVAEFVGAFHAETPLDIDEVELLPDLIATRLLATVTLTEWRAGLHPENRDYILRNNSAAWRMLEQLGSLSHADLIEYLLDARQLCWRAPSQSTAARARDTDLIARRSRLMGPAYRLFYDEPIHVVCGRGVWLYGADGRRYLDVYNNVPHVGHCHPRVTAALSAQARLLNTHTRYLHETVLDYAERLVATFPAPLESAMLTCTGSEANELALRIARAATGARGIIATEYAYHGNTSAIAALGTNYYPSAETPSAHVRTVPAPDAFRRRYNLDNDALAEAYANCVAEAIESLAADGIRLAALIVDPLFTSDGIVRAPSGFLARAARHVRNAGGLLIADEVQSGLGRTGSHFWGFEAHGVVPDIATMGKPLGNGHPLAAVVTSRELLDRFAATTRYFNTFGGNPVSSAVGLAVLEVMEEERLQQNARDVGAYLCAGLETLARHHTLIGDVRGAGLFVGAELVLDRRTLEPATSETRRVVNGLKDRGILTNSIGPHANVLKLRPPMVFRRDHADQLLETLAEVLARL
jgi:4-aminobutyrate aminotransferase-like enzyme/Ser/Thr protein kinase RdoA (MazF antagonist)